MPLHAASATPAARGGKAKLAELQQRNFHVEGRTKRERHLCRGAPGPRRPPAETGNGVFGHLAKSHHAGPLGAIVDHAVKAAELGDADARAWLLDAISAQAALRTFFDIEIGNPVNPVEAALADLHAGRIPGIEPLPGHPLPGPG